MRSLLVAVVAATLLSAPALAQTLTGAPRRNAPPTEAMRKMQLLAQCAAREHPDTSARLLATVRGSRAENGAAHDLVDKSWRACRTTPQDRLRFDVTLLRGGISEARYFERFARDRPPASAPEVPHDPARFEKPALAVLSLFGGCVAAARPADVHALLLTEAGSPAELAALKSIEPTLGTCLYKGMAADFSRSQLRANLAEALYRQATAALGPSDTNAP